MRSLKRIAARIPAATAALFLLPHLVAAEEPALGEIIVTAEKRQTDLQKTAAAISVVSGDTLANEQIHSILDVTGSLPNVNIGTVTGQADIAIRGIGFGTLNPGDEGRIAFYTDGIYVARPSNQLGSFFDIDHVEVLRGPQGTLYGRNATGGAFQLLTRNPTRDLSGYFNVTAGNYGLIQTEGAISGPLSATLSGRISFQTVNRGGYGHNLFDGTPINNANMQAVRAKLLWEPSDNFESTLTGHYSHEKDRNYGFLWLGPAIPGIPLTFPTLINSQNIRTNNDFEDYRESYGADLNSVYHLSNSVQLKTLVGYEHSNYNVKEDGDGSTLYLIRSESAENSNETTAEVQLVGDVERMHWIAGLYYFHEIDTPLNRTPLSGLPFGLPNILYQGDAIFATLKTNAGAGYGNFTYDFTDKLSATVGARYSVEEKKDLGDTQELDFVRLYTGTFLPTIPSPGFPVNQEKTFYSFTPTATLDYKFTPQIYGYATYSRGYKSGGFNFGSLQHAFNPEKITDYEIGLKTKFFNSLLTTNVAVFHYDYSNIQTQIVTLTPPSIIVENAGASQVDGIEAEIVAVPTSGLRLDASIGLLNARYTEFLTADPSRPALGTLNLDGNKLPYAPAYTLNTGVQYEWPVLQGTVTLRGEYLRVARAFFTPFNLDTISQSAYGLGNAFLTLKADDHISATVFVRNIGDTFVKSFGFVGLANIGSPVEGTVQPPRTYGVTLGYKF
jgi:iron complex outermembrane recepter protein